MVQIDAQAEAHIEAYVVARRDLLQLWAAKQRLHRAAQSRFPKSHPLFKTISTLCHNDATCQIRQLCDIAICKCADRFGEDLFRDKVVDDVRIPAVTHWYYGISHLFPKENVVLDRTKQLAVSDVELFDKVYRLGRKFIETASTLPFLPTKEFALNENRFEKAFEKARARVEESSPLYAAYSRLQEKVPHPIVGKIVAFSEE